MSAGCEKDGDIIKYTTAGGWRLNLYADFIPLLSSNEFNSSAQITTDSETIKCSGTILAQHSRVLKKSLEGSKELHIPDNQHVREFLSILNGGSVKLTLENFPDILKLMMMFDLPEVRKQILQRLGSLEMTLRKDLSILNHVQIIFNGLINCAKSSTDKAMTNEIYRPCRDLLTGYKLALYQCYGVIKRKWWISFQAAMLDLSSVHWSPGSLRWEEEVKIIHAEGVVHQVMDSLISGVDDKNGLIAILLHEDLFSHYIHWIKLLLDQSNYNLLTEFIATTDSVATWAKCPGTLSSELLDKLVGLDVSASQDTLSIQRHQAVIRRHFILVKSFEQMREKGTLFSFWKLLDKDDIRYLPWLLTARSDQFCVVECLLSWIHANEPEDVSFAPDFLKQAFVLNLSSWLGREGSVHRYRFMHVEKVLEEMGVSNLSDKSWPFRVDGTKLSLTLENVYYKETGSGYIMGSNGEMTRRFCPEDQTEEITIMFSLEEKRRIEPHPFQQFIKRPLSDIGIIVALFPDKIPTIKTYVGSSLECPQFLSARVKWCTETSKVPLYCEPDKAYKTILQAMKDDPKFYRANLDRDVTFDYFDLGRRI